MKSEIRILMIEHEPNDVELIQHELKTAKMEFVGEVVQNEKEYILALHEFKPDIILSDYTFPSFDGVRAFRIRQKLASDVPFIIVSGTIGEEKSIELIRTGVTDYALKENLVSLPFKIKRALREAKEKREKEKTSYALSEALSQINKIMDSSPDIICTVDESGNFTRVSAACELIWGYTPEELVGKNVNSFILQDDLARTESAIKTVMTGKDLTNFENVYIHKNGSSVPMIWSARWNAKDQMRYAVGRDATEKKRTELALERERERFYNLFLQAPLSIGVLKGPRHVYEMVNPLYLTLIGKKDIIGKTVEEILPEVVGQGFIRLLDQVYSTGIPFFSNETLVKLDKAGDGVLIDVYLNIVYQPYKNVKGVVDRIFFFIVNVTEQILTRKKIELGDKKYRQIVETAQEGIWLVDESNLTTLVNKKMADILETSPDELMGEHPYRYMDDVWKEKASLQIADRKAGLSENYDFKYRTACGNEVWTNISANPFFNEKGIYKGVLAMVTDITQRKKAEAALIKSDSQLRLATEIAKLGYWEYDVANDLFTFTDQFYAIFRTTVEKVGGYHLNAEQYAELFVYPEDQAIVKNSVIAAVKSRDASYSFKAEHRIIYANGEIGHISVHFYIVKDAEGRTIKNFGVNQDITERVKTEEKIKESNQRFDYVTKATSDAIWDWDLIRETIYWGEGFENIFGYHFRHSRNSIDTWTDYIHPDDLGRVMKKIYRYIDGNETNWEDQYRYLKKDQSYAYVIDKGFILRDENNKAIRMVGAMQDITKQKREEQHLRLLESVITHSNDAVLITDAGSADVQDAKIVYVNKAFTLMTGYDTNDVMGKSPAILLGENSNPEHLKSLNNALKSWQSCEMTSTHYKKNGIAFWNHFTASPLADMAGLYTHWIYIQRDVTERKHSEMVLDEMNRNMQKHVKELAVSNAELEQFAYVTSHDLQEPLRMVTSFLTLLEKKYGKLIDERGKTYINFAVDGAKRMRHIILDLLEFSKVGRTEEKREKINLNELVKEIEILFRKEIREKKAHIHVIQLPLIFAFKAPVLQVFQNLISNALKYSVPGIPVNIQISAEDLITHWRFSFEDNGIGIDKEYFDKIFIIFQRLHNKSEFPGTGMGLALTKKIIENQGGKIWLTSEEGKGSVFYFTILKSD